MLLLKEEQIEISDSNYNSLTNQTYFQEFYAFITQKRIFLRSLFIVLVQSLPSYNDPMFYYLSNELDFFPSEIGFVSIFSYIGSITAIICYRYYFKNFTFKTVMMGGNFLYFIFSFLTYCLVKRYNLMLGIPDFLIVIISNAALYLIGEIMLMPILSFACVVCPKHLEASVYAYFLSLISFSSIVSSLLGGLLTFLLEIKANLFRNLPLLVLIENISYLVPLIWLNWLKESYFNYNNESENDNEIKQENQHKLVKENKKMRKQLLH